MQYHKKGILNILFMLGLYCIHIQNISIFWVLSEKNDCIFFKEFLVSV